MASPRWYTRAAVDGFILSKPVQYTVIVVILINAAILGLETVSTLTPQTRQLLHVLDTICLSIFVVEIALKLYGRGWRFFRDPWNVFDFLVVGVALIPGSNGLAVLRALRVLRVLRLISVVPALRRVVDALVRAVPGIASIALLFVILFYVGAVMATTLFGEQFPETFGSLGASLFSLFQVTTLDNWSTLVRDVSAVLPWAPAFFIPFVLISALTMLNLFIAVIVDAMQGLGRPSGSGVEKGRDADEAAPARGDAELSAEIALLREQIAALTEAVNKR